MKLSDGRRRRGSISGLWIVMLLALAAGTILNAQDKAFDKKMKGFDVYLAKVLKMASFRLIS